MKYLLIFCLIASVSGYMRVNAETAYTCPFLELNIDARTQGLGGAGALLSGKASSFLLNPGSIGFTARKDVQFMHQWLFEGMAMHDYAGIAVPLLLNDGAAALNVIRKGEDDVPVFPDWIEAGNAADKTDYIVNNRPEYISYSDMAFFMSFSKKYEQTIDLGWQYFIIPVEYAWGINFKYIHQNMEGYGTSSGIGFDLGGVARVDAARIFSEEKPLGHILLGLAFRDIANTSVKWESGHSSRIGYDIRLSAGYEQPAIPIKSDFLAVFDYGTKYNDFHYGIEYQYHKTVAVRVGLNEGRLTAGAGLKRWGARVDYAFSSGDLAVSHMISCGLSF